MNPNSPEPPPGGPTSSTPPRWRTTGVAVGLVPLVAVAGVWSVPIALLLLVAALAAVWSLPPWRRSARFGASLAALVLLPAGAVLGGRLVVLPDAGPAGDAKPEGAPAASAAPAPDYVWRPLDSAESAATVAGFDTAHHDASDRDRVIVAPEDWTVCFQTPGRTGTDARPGLDFAAVRHDEECPRRDGLPVPGSPPRAGQQASGATMPDLTGGTWSAAVTTLTGLGIARDAVTAAPRYANDPVPAAEFDTWRVCGQSPARGAAVAAPAAVKLTLAAPAAGCGARGDRLPDRDGDGRPDYQEGTLGDDGE
ncbi:PASTA domain-containing protein [Streptomyces sp. NPDC008150]|uniref:PASTA domain-containing protein n=1 Tax=Streptomyces sp. NPDC008150 TaxID=3364816 RepID=UPI0036E72B96